MKDKTVFLKISLMINCVEEELREALNKAIDDGFYINYLKANAKERLFFIASSTGVLLESPLFYGTVIF